MHLDVRVSLARHRASTRDFELAHTKHEYVIDSTESTRDDARWHGALQQFVNENVTIM